MSDKTLLGGANTSFFVDRNEQGEIVALYANPQREKHEELQKSDPEIQAYGEAHEARKAALLQESIDKEQAIVDLKAENEALKAVLKETIPDLDAKLEAAQAEIASASVDAVK